MKSLSAIALLVFLVIENVAGQTYTVREIENISSGTTAVYMSNNFITSNLELAGGTFYFTGNETMFFLTVSYKGQDVSNIREIILIVDEEEIHLKNIFRKQRQNSLEVVGFSVEPEVLKKVGHAKRTKINLVGYGGYTAELTDENIRRFKRFSDRYIK